MSIINKYTSEVFPVNFAYNNIDNKTDYAYKDLIYHILEEGIWKQNRTGVKTISIFGPQIKFKDVGERFPLLTLKKIHLKSIIGELLWFLSGSTDKNVLKNKYKTTIWDEWNAPNPKFDGDMGPIYGYQWVNWNGEGINQIQSVIDRLKTTPDDRRLLVSAWNPSDLPQMALPPCHWSFQLYSVQYPDKDKRTLDLKVNIRSWDYFIGSSFNIASYAILLLMIANEVNMIPGDLTISAGDVHLYENHLPYVYELMSRKSLGVEPVMNINKSKSIWDFEVSDFELTGYVAHPNWKNVPVAV